VHKDSLRQPTSIVKHDLWLSVERCCCYGSDGFGKDDIRCTPCRISYRCTTTFGPPVMFRLPLFSLPPESSQFMGNRFHVVSTLIWHPEVPFGFTHPLLLLGLCTHYFVLVYAPPPLSYLGLRTHLFIWVYAPTISVGTMYPHVPLGLCTLVCLWDYAPSFANRFTHPHFCLGYHPLFAWFMHPVFLSG
jgi:hypothetical protein